MNKYKGAITISLNFENRVDTIPYQYEVCEHNSKVSETIINNFEWLNLSCEEKKILTWADRKDILSLKNFSYNEIINHAQQLKLLINHFECSHITLSAGFFGALISVAAISTSDSIPDRYFTLHLHNLPPQLIPHELTNILEKTKSKIVFHSESQENLEKFGSLFQNNKILGFPPVIIEKQIPHKLRNSA